MDDAVDGAADADAIVSLPVWKLIVLFAFFSLSPTKSQVVFLHNKNIDITLYKGIKLAICNE